MLFELPIFYFRVKKIIIKPQINETADATRDTIGLAVINKANKKQIVRISETINNPGTSRRLTKVPISS